ncbi:hypothetical protein [Thermostaphylospora chromogena]|uniref:Uncharacterized protein n=1 Tax=Thermostaphylospora chromogena TaxID=35622 RepID=A0A1H1E805_9ACTN|nr:hypothetical protein [Thermostaphylospora chromogena]SDQ84306.1 hypothetical protein SAMN04489764_2336 [Thermostaphylospora chromogena]
MSKVRHVAIVGAITVAAVTGCTAEADTAPSNSPSPVSDTSTESPAPAESREPIKVTLDPERVVEGERSSVWILANCPVPTGGPALTGRATSEAFARAVTLDPMPPTPTASPSPEGSSSPSPIPWVRGEAVVPAGIEAGTYEVNVTCPGTNDSGSARLRVVAQPTIVPSRAPRAGGGGTAAGGPADESGVPFGVTGLVLAAAVAGGIGLAVRRRRS